MAIIDSYGTVNNGDVLEDGWFNEGYNSETKNSVLDIYTGTDFNFIGVQSVTTNTKEFTYTSTQLASSDYLEIYLLGVCYAEYDDAESRAGRVQVKIETKETGGSYSDSLSTQTIMNTNGSSEGLSESRSIKHIHELTSGEKSNGIVVKVSVIGNSDGPYSETSFTLQELTLISMR
jgi:hypothetical protein